MIMYSSSIKGIKKGGTTMKGYNVADGYMGYLEGEYRLFASEEDYLDFVED